MAKQSFPLRRDGHGSGYNFTNLHLLHEESNLILKERRMEKKTDKYINNNIQNEMRKIMTLKILREIAKISKLLVFIL